MLDEHEFFVDVGGFESHQFGAPHAGGIERHQDGAVEQVGGGVDETGDFFGAQHGGQAERGFGEGDVL